MSIKIEGNWAAGLAYDVHTLSSTYLGADERGIDHWDTEYTEMGRLVNGLKYRGQTRNVPKIIDLITAKIKGLETFDLIVPIPASKKRPFQPVEELAKELGRRKRVRVVKALKKIGSGEELKEIKDPQKRKEALEARLQLADDYDFSGKKLLLLDDLYRSGSTLTVATDILYQSTNADRICVLTMTKTRSIR